MDYLFITCRQVVGPEVRRGLLALWLGALLPLGAQPNWWDWVTANSAQGSIQCGGGRWCG